MRSVSDLVGRVATQAQNLSGWLSTNPYAGRVWTPISSFVTPYIQTVWIRVRPYAASFAAKSPTKQWALTAAVGVGLAIFFKSFNENKISD